MRLESFNFEDLDFNHDPEEIHGVDTPEEFKISIQAFQYNIRLQEKIFIRPNETISIWFYILDITVTILLIICCCSTMCCYCSCKCYKLCACCCSKDKNCDFTQFAQIVRFCILLYFNISIFKKDWFRQFSKTFKYIHYFELLL